MTINIHIDHIDPKWEEGRSYQLVCGLNVVYNMCERDPFLNNSKSNRFVPWRWCKDGFGGVPVEQGDLCLFLDYDTNEWMLEEFLGSWWYEQTRLWGFCHTQSRPQTDETKRKIGEANSGRAPTEETKRKLSKVAKGRVKSAEHQRKITEALRGRTFSEEWRRRISESLKLRSARRRCRSMSLSDPQMPDFED